MQRDMTLSELGEEYGSGGDNLKVVDLSELLSLDFPPREMILAPILPTQSLAMVFAKRGVGKTYFALGIAYAVATGGKFMKWQASKPRNVLLIDGEMPATVLQDRLARIVSGSDKNPDADLRIMTPDLQQQGMPNLSDPKDQDRIEQYAENADLILVDNISTLCRSGRENESESWLTIQGWALRQRARGRSVLFIHHSGKGGQQRGTSRREDVLDVVIELRHPADYTPDQGASFEVHFTKARGLQGDDVRPFHTQLTEDQVGNLAWKFSDLEQSNLAKVANLLNDDYTQIEIADELGLSGGYVSKLKRQAQTKGLLKPRVS